MLFFNFHHTFVKREMQAERTKHLNTFVKDPIFERCSVKTVMNYTCWNLFNLK